MCRHKNNLRLQQQIACLLKASQTETNYKDLKFEEKNHMKSYIRIFKIKITFKKLSIFNYRKA